MVRDSGGRKRSRRRMEAEGRIHTHCLRVLRDGWETEVHQGSHNAENMAIWTSSSFLILFLLRS